MLKLVASSVTNSGICSNTNINIYRYRYRVTSLHTIVDYNLSTFRDTCGKLKKIYSRWDRSRNTISIRDIEKEIVIIRKYDSNFLVIYAERSFLVAVEGGRGGRKKKEKKKNDK